MHFQSLSLSGPFYNMAFLNTYTQKHLLTRSRSAAQDAVSSDPSHQLAIPTSSAHNSSKMWTS